MSPRSFKRINIKTSFSIKILVKNKKNHRYLFLS